MVASRALRIVFFGTPAFALPTLDALLASRHPVVGVVTQPDRPRGRGQKVAFAPIKARAVEADLPVLQPEKLSDVGFKEALARFEADMGVVAAYGKILSQSVLDTPRLGMLNVHASLLPRHRGAAPVHRAIIAGDATTGVTIMRVVKALDAGPMLATVARPITPFETSEDVEQDLARLGATLLLDTVDRLVEGPVDEVAQDESQATYAHRLTREDGVIDWSQPTARIHDLIRGLHPWPHAYSSLGGHRFILHRSRPVASATAAGTEPGTVLEASGDRLWVATGTGVLQIDEMQSEGRRPMAVREFLAGHRMTPGERFGPLP